MKIRPGTLGPTQPNDNTALKKAYSPAAEPGRSQEPAQDSVHLSSTARALQQLQDSSGDIHSERVQALKAALNSGELRIDPAAIADGLLDAAQDLIK